MKNSREQSITDKGAVATSRLAAIKAKLARRPDTEHQQILIRMAITIVIAGYIIAVDDQPRALIAAASVLAIGLIASPILLWFLLRDEGISEIRRGIAVAIDGILIPITAVIGGTTTLPFISFAVWLSIAHGFRYGPGYLQATLMLGTVSTITAVWLDPTLNEHTGFVFIMALGLVALPLYFNNLLAKRQQTNDLLHAAARADTLTSLPNRTSLTERFAEPVSEATTVTILAIDLDGFKSVNDSCGHQAGDRLLVAVAKRLRHAMGPQDQAFRLGGDEFAIVHVAELSQNVDSAETLAHRLLESLRAPFQLGIAASAISASIGIATAQPGVCASQQLLDEADQALYLAKRHGRNRVVWFSSELRAKMQREAHVEQRLRLAIAQDLIKLHFQPQIDTLNGRIIGVEALARWQDELLGNVPPFEFVSIAERSELVQTMGYQVLYNACMTAAKWRGGAAELSISVNVSVLELLQDDFLTGVHQCLNQSGLDPERLELEVTETKVADQRIVGKLDALRSMGVHLAMDDFGAGATSLASLRHLPFDRLKLDKGLVDELESDTNARAVAFAVINLAHSLGQLVIAEGVENKFQNDLLIDHGCNRLQGYYFAKAMPEEELLKTYFTDPTMPDRRRYVPQLAT